MESWIIDDTLELVGTIAIDVRKHSFVDSIRNRTCIGSKRITTVPQTMHSYILTL
jgi:hypothetical protein